MLQWTCEYSAGVERATSNESNLSLAGSCYAVRLTQRLLKKYYLFNKKLLYLVDDMFWQMGFNSADRQEKAVILIICIVKFI